MAAIVENGTMKKEYKNVSTLQAIVTCSDVLNPMVIVRVNVQLFFYFFILWPQLFSLSPFGDLFRPGNDSY